MWDLKNWPPNAPVIREVEPQLTRTRLTEEHKHRAERERRRAVEYLTSLNMSGRAKKVDEAQNKTASQQVERISAVLVHGVRSVLATWTGDFPS